LYNNILYPVQLSLHIYCTNSDVHIFSVTKYFNQFIQMNTQILSFYSQKLI
jgi:hypothetical protein